MKENLKIFQSLQQKNVQIIQLSYSQIRVRLFFLSRVVVGYVFKWVSLRVKSVNVLLGSILLGKFVSQIIRKSYSKKLFEKRIKDNHLILSSSLENSALSYLYLIFL